jgi:uncharacterized protein (TIGR03437 family)
VRVIPRAGRNLLWLALFLSQPALASPPILSYSTYLSGASATAIAVDKAGNGYVGLTGSIAKLDPTGAHILATYPAPNIVVNALALDSSGNLIAAGAGAPQQASVPPGGAPGGAIAAGWVAKFDATGNSIFTAFPTSVPSITAVAVDPSGNIYIAGPVNTLAGDSNAVVGKMTATGAFISYVYAYSFGGSKNDTPRAIAVDGQGNVYVAGDTLSSDFPVTSGAAQSKFGGGAAAPGYPSYGDAFLAKIDPTGSKILYATYWGGSSADVAYAIGLDAAGNAYLAGGTSSADFPVTAGAFQTRYAGPPADPTAPDPAGDAFVVKFSPSGAALWSTYWGGASADVAYALTLDSAGNVYFAGTTESFADFPKAGPAIPTCRQTGGPFVAALDPSGAKLLHSSGMAGLGYDNAYALALDSTGAVYFAGETASRVFFATPGAAQTTYAAGTRDAFAARIDFTAAGTYAACVLNGASFAAGNTTSFPLGTVAPGEIVSVFGSAIGPATPQGLQFTSAGAVSTSLAGVSVSFDGIPAPLLYVSATQINAVVPYGLAAASTQMTVSYNGQSYGPLSMPVAAAVPAIFTATQTGHGQAAVLNQDGTLNSIANPAARGSVITLFAEGAGIMNPGVPDGSVSTGPTLPVPEQPVTVVIRGVDATVQYAGAAPTFVAGLLQVNVLVPTSIDFGNLVPLMLNVGSFGSQLDVTIALK